MLKQGFKDLLKNYTNHLNHVNELWEEIQNHYSGVERHYHNLEHLENLFKRLKRIKPYITNWNSILFAVYYHDIIYSPTQNDNEIKSAELAVSRLKKIMVPEEDIKSCQEMILATQSHLLSQNEDINYFTDADLSILGESRENYMIYCKNIRKEYSIYPDEIYRAGRMKLLNQLLKRQRIFHTKYFFAKFESQAKRNLNQELLFLSENKPL